VAAFTTDGDIVIDPSLLPSTPPLEATLERAGFTRATQPGSWARAVTIDGHMIDVCVDFMVPETVAPGSGRRSVELEGYDRHSTRRVNGLEAALVDRGPRRIAAIDPADHRAIVAQVAGPAALMIAKLHKIGERVESGRHRRTPVDKDAGDLYRLVQVTSIPEMAAGFRLALSSDVARPVAAMNSFSVVGSTLATRARSRRVQPRMTRSRSSTNGLADHPCPIRSFDLCESFVSHLRRGVEGARTLRLHEATTSWRRALAVWPSEARVTELEEPFTDSPEQLTADHR
jgi:hypothetical protein